MHGSSCGSSTTCWTQLQLLQLLDWFSAAELGDTRLELICIDRFEGIEPFRGIGQLTPEQMASAP